MAFSNFQDGAGGRASRPKWMLLGQEGGAIVRGQVSRILSGAALTQVRNLFHWHLFTAERISIIRTLLSLNHLLKKSSQRCAEITSTTSRISGQ
jgi:hypothetical protein